VSFGNLIGDHIKAAADTCANLKPRSPMPNIYQPQFLQTTPWISMAFTPPEAALKAPGMMSHDERIMLSWLAGQAYQGHGEIVELGVFIGSSTISLASGLERNKNVQDKTKRIHAFDLFAGDYEAKFIREQYGREVDAEGSFLAIYEENIAAHRDFVDVHVGDITTAQWSGKPIEILFVDVLKAQQTVGPVVQRFFPHLRAGRSLVIMQDYNYQTLPYSAVLMEHFGEYFTYAGETQNNSVVFVNTREIPADLMADFCYEALPESLRLHYLMQVLGKRPTFFGRECIAHQIKDFLERGWT
jgi:hypothetical protein